MDHPLVNGPKAPNIKELNKYYRQEGVRLSVNAGKQALKEWGGCPDEITHVVSTTCTNSANPGFDHYVIKELGISSNIDKVLLHGIGCSGGLAAIRTAANFALGSSFRRKPARILVLACEITTLLVRSELDSVCENEEVRIGPCLFGDCASACILSNGIGESTTVEPIYEIRGWKHEIIEDTEDDLGFDADPLGKRSRPLWFTWAELTYSRLEGYPYTSGPLTCFCQRFASLPGSNPVPPTDIQRRCTDKGYRLRLGFTPRWLYDHHRRGTGDEPHARTSSSQLRNLYEVWK